MKISGKRSAGNPHATFDAAGDGNGANKPPRHYSTLPERSCWKSALYQKNNSLATYSTARAVRGEEALKRFFSI
jgi:hypothetical protein